MWTSHLHGLPSHHTEATPTCGLLFIDCRSGTPAAYSIAWKVFSTRSLIFLSTKSDLRSWKVMILRDCGRISVQSWHPILHDSIG